MPSSTLGGEFGASAFGALGGVYFPQPGDFLIFREFFQLGEFSKNEITGSKMGTISKLA
jgi:hypothetical protein